MANKDENLAAAQSLIDYVCNEVADVILGRPSLNTCVWWRGRVSGMADAARRICPTVNVGPADEAVERLNWVAAQHNSKGKVATKLIPASVAMTSEQALNYVLKEEPDQVLIIGYFDAGNDGDGETRIRSSAITRSDALWMAELAKANALESDEVS